MCAGSALLSDKIAECFKNFLRIPQLFRTAMSPWHMIVLKNISGSEICHSDQLPPVYRQMFLFESLGWWRFCLFKRPILHLPHQPSKLFCLSSFFSSPLRRSWLTVFDLYLIFSFFYSPIRGSFFTVFESLQNLRSY